MQDEESQEVDSTILVNEMVEDFLIETRRLLLIGSIDEISSTHICSYLQILSLSTDPIYMYINSEGGCMASGYAIIDQMRLCRCPIYTIVRGNAYSMGAMIAAYGERGHRYSTSNSSLMLHGAIIQGGSASLDQHIVMVDYMRRDYISKISSLAKRLKITTTELRELMFKTGWMTPKEAIKIGLIDRIWTSKMEQGIK